MKKICFLGYYLIRKTNHKRIMCQLHACRVYHLLQAFPLQLRLLWLNLFLVPPRDFQRKHLVAVAHHHLPDPKE